MTWYHGFYKLLPEEMIQKSGVLLEFGNVEVVGWVASGSDTKMKNSGRRFMFDSLS